ncbi:MAG: hypothetical protein IPK65_12520 [Gammaproteobacteria bacterium]|nr:hypothetical protein [Gammaproteobacteria bacterium]
MTDIMIESVLMAFMVGGIVGAAIALSLRSSKAWSRQYDPDGAAELQPLRLRPGRQRYRR